MVESTTCCATSAIAIVGGYSAEDPAAFCFLSISPDLFSMSIGALLSQRYR